ncbi:AMP-binding protein [Imbroritus primus]|uniref:AMP-binding protein n=1 Tax=Imbroritus primus TaxID=3058603 RepID=A0ACD3SMD8_9BURK|nr:AMP-binding protein [Burkholderiaceae bacterium PBA]
MSEQPWVERTFGDALLWASREYGSREAVVYGADRISFTQLADRVRAFARGLIAQGIESGEHVALWMADRPDWLVARWAIPMIGAVLVPVNTRFREKDVGYVLAQSDARTLIVQHGAVRGVRYLDILERLEPGLATQPQGAWQCKEMPELRRVIGLQADESTPLPDSITSFAAIEAAGKALLDDGVLEQRVASVKPGDVAQILYTSGTTSFPKGAMVCHGPLLQNNAYAAWCFGFDTKDRYLASVPLFTATGTGYTLALWLSGATMVIDSNPYDVHNFCTIIERERITASFFVDTIVQDLKGYAARDTHDLSSLRVGYGAPLPTASFLWLVNTLGVHDMIGTYGMSETTNAVSRTRYGDPLDKRAHTNGRPCAGVQVRIVDIDTETALPPGKVGEIRVAGYTVMPGYYKRPDENAKTFDAEGWLRTGDLGELDADGYLIYRGRVKEMIKPSGFNVATQEIEEFLQTYPGVRQAVVVGVPDARLGEVAYAYVETLAGADVSAEALIRYCKDNIASYKAPRYVEFVTEWPLTGSQKIKKLELKTRANATLQALQEQAPAQAPAQPSIPAA